MSRAGRRESESEIDDWMRVLDRLPFVSSIKRDLSALRRLLYDRRAPRVAAVGMPGSGRTSLANALLSALTFGDGGVAPPPAPGHWVRIDADGRRLDWLELPAERDRDALIDLARRAFDESLPDLVVGTIEAGDERGAAAVHEAFSALLRDLGAHYKKHKPPVLVLLTKADTIEPRALLPSEKEGAIEAALVQLRKSLADLGQPDESFLALATPAGSARWNVASVGEAILERLPEPAQIEAVRALDVGREARRTVARTLVNSSSALAITVGLAPIPFADAFILLPLQAAMVTGIAYLSGRPWDRRAAAEWITSVGVVGGAGMGLRWGAQQLVKLVPGAGSVVGAGVAGAGTLAIGRSAIAYFIDGPGGAFRRLELRAENP